MRPFQAGLRSQQRATERLISPTLTEIEPVICWLKSHVIDHLTVVSRDQSQVDYHQPFPVL